MPDWCVLRTSGRHTLRLAESLTQDGFEAWTPVETRMIRIPRANVRRTVKLPIMPSYVFAKASNLIDLIQMSGMKPIPRQNKRPFDRSEEWRPFHADFSVMRYHDSIATIADGHLMGLRTLEAKKTPRKRADRIFPAGLSVRVKTEGGSFAGMSGRVERSDHGLTLVCFDNRLTVKISTSLLDIDDVGNPKALIGLAARLAA